MYFPSSLALKYVSSRFRTAGTETRKVYARSRHCKELFPPVVLKGCFSECTIKEHFSYQNKNRVSPANPLLDQLIKGPLHAANPL
jgi:hypothetical protein